MINVIESIVELIVSFSVAGLRRAPTVPQATPLVQQEPGVGCHPLLVCLDRNRSGQSAPLAKLPQSRSFARWSVPQSSVRVALYASHL